MAYLCTVPECGKPRHKREWCSRHYQRWRKYGDPLGCGSIHGKGLRFIANVALFHEGDECLFWPYGGGKGYGAVNLDGRKQIASRVVCEAAHGPPPSAQHETAHACGNGHLGCVSPSHVRWATHAENMADKLRHGTDNRGERHPRAKVTTDHVRQIRRLVAAGAPQRKVGRWFGLSQSQVSYIASGHAWKWLGAAEGA